MIPSVTNGASSDRSPTAHEQAVVTAAIDWLRELPGALLPILHEIQAGLGYVPPTALEPIAAALNLSRADVHGVLTYYHDFRTTPPGRHVLKLCRAEACQAVGAEALERRVHARVGPSLPATSPDGSVTVEAVYCLGNCALGPSVQLDGRLVGRVTVARLDSLLDTLRNAVVGSRPTATPLGDRR